MRIANVTISKCYPASPFNFESARDYYQRPRLAAEWEESLRWLCGAYYCKTSFINKYRALATISKQPDRPSLNQSFVLERAKVRWGKLHAGTGL